MSKEFEGKTLNDLEEMKKQIIKEIKKVKQDIFYYKQFQNKDLSNQFDSIFYDLTYKLGKVVVEIEVDRVI